jgi:hypothetical protein
MYQGHGQLRAERGQFLFKNNKQIQVKWKDYNFSEESSSELS